MIRRMESRFEGNAGDGALALRDEHSPARARLVATLQILDHLLPEGGCRVIVGQRHATEVFNLATVV